MVVPSFSVRSISTTVLSGGTPMRLSCQPKVKTQRIARRYYDAWTTGDTPTVIAERTAGMS